MEWKSYIVGLVDILKQSDKLAELDSLLWKEQDSGNLSENESKKKTEFTKETCEEVERFRETFTFSFNDWKERLHKDPVMNSLSPADRDTMTKIANGICRLRFFPDMIMFYIPFDVREELANHIWITAMLIACSSVFQLKSKEGIFFRGGIEIGAGTELRNGDIYGPVLCEIHKLEKNIAKYPRVVIGKRLYDFIQRKEQVSYAGDFLNAVLTRTKDICKSLVCRDDDGELIVDYLGKQAMELNRSDQNQYNRACLFIKEGKAKVEEELYEHIKKGNSELMERYGKLWVYYQSRMKYWV